MPLSFLDVDIICAQGGEGGHTAFSILIPAVMDLCKGANSPLTGEPVIVVAAGGIADGRGLAAALSLVISRYSLFITIIVMIQVWCFWCLGWNSLCSKCRSRCTNKA
jgi:hypothetical protein